MEYCQDVFQHLMLSVLQANEIYQSEQVMSVGIAFQDKMTVENVR